MRLPQMTMDCVMLTAKADWLEHIFSWAWYVATSSRWNLLHVLSEQPTFTVIFCRIPTLSHHWGFFVLQSGQLVALGLLGGKNLKEFGDITDCQDLGKVTKSPCFSLRTCILQRSWVLRITVAGSGAWIWVFYSCHSPWLVSEAEVKLPANNRWHWPEVTGPTGETSHINSLCTSLTGKVHAFIRSVKALSTQEPSSMLMAALYRKKKKKVWLRFLNAPEVITMLFILGLYPFSVFGH